MVNGENNTDLQRRNLRLIEPENEFVQSVVSASSGETDNENEVKHIMTIFSNILDWICLPVLNLRNLLIWTFPVNFVNIRDIQWKYWITLLLVSYLLYWQNIFVVFLQTCVNYYRSTCNCDIIRLTRMVDIVEGLTIWFNTDKDQELKYFICRSICI